MKSETQRNKQRIIEMLRSDTYNLTELTRIVGIDRKMYYDWLKDDPDFAKGVEEAKEEFQKSLRKFIQGCMVETTTIIYAPSKTKFDANGNPLPEFKERKTIRKPLMMIDS